MQISDDTPEPGQTPEIYPKHPPVNMLLEPKQLRPDNFFAFDGIDGSGKSTIVREVARRLAQRGELTKVFKLGRSDLVRHAMPRATWLNSDPITLNLLNWVSVFEQVTENSHLLNTPTILMFDRYFLTIKVRGVLEGMATDFMDILTRAAPQPKILFMLDCDPAICLDRILAAGRTVTYFEAGARVVPRQGAPMIEPDPDIRRFSPDRERLALGHLVRMREQFLQLAAGCDYVRTLDTSGSLDAVVDEVVRTIDGRAAAARP